MASEFIKYLQYDSILFLDGCSKKNALEDIISHAATRCTMDEEQIRDAVWKRERMMTTGVGKGLALPHIRVNGFPSPLVIMGICRNPIADYESMDDLPIKLIVFLAADEKNQEDYLTLLGSISAKLKQSNFMDELLSLGEDRDKIMHFLNA